MRLLLRPGPAAVFPTSTSAVDLWQHTQAEHSLIESNHCDLYLQRGFAAIHSSPAMLCHRAHLVVLIVHAYIQVWLRLGVCLWYRPIAELSAV